MSITKWHIHSRHFDDLECPSRLLACCKPFQVQFFCAVVQQLVVQIVSHSPSAVAELLVHLNYMMTTEWTWPVWLNGRAFAHDPKGHGFESRLFRFQVTALGKLLTCMCLCHQAV